MKKPKPKNRCKGPAMFLPDLTASSVELVSMKFDVDACPDVDWEEAMKELMDPEFKPWEHMGK